jgi:hypothetical protein
MKWKLQEKREKKKKISKIAFKKKKKVKRRFSFQKIKMSPLNFYFVYLTFPSKGNNNNNNNRSFFLIDFLAFFKHELINLTTLNLQNVF